MARRYNTRRIKKHRQYIVEDLAEAMGFCEATVRTWIRDGLPCIDDRKPSLVVGYQAQVFLEKKNSRSAMTLGLGEFYCFKCKDRRRPAGKMADFEATSPTSGRLIALCEVCETVCYRSVSKAQLAELGDSIQIEIKVNERT